jgi:xanthine/uracil permease
MLGALVLITGLFFADSVDTLFKLFPPALLGVILMFGGLELAAGVRTSGGSKADRYVMLFTAGLAIWNMGVAYLAGLALWYGFERGWLKA